MRRGLGVILFVAIMAALLSPARSQEPPREGMALLISDVHFDPFWDPEKVAKLAAAPARDWQKIIESTPSPDRALRFAALNGSCQARGEDTSYPLLASALASIQTHAAETQFMTVSGDLIAHQFDCKFHTLFPGAKPREYRAFVEKTIAFVLGELRRVAPDEPQYVALGNNDSDCGDYKMDPNGPFLADLGALIAPQMPHQEHADAMKTFKAGGYYSAMLPSPVGKTRLLVLNDVLLSPKYASCRGTASLAPGNAEMAWLSRQLADARAAHQHAWVMGHIPPGVNAYSTLSHFGSNCSGKAPTMFLATDQLGQELVDAGDLISLAIFGHTHEDEIKPLEPEAAAASAGPSGSGADAVAKGGAVAVKIVPSITPINGNNPSFTIAQVNPLTAVMEDYRVFAAGSQTGSKDWPELYDFDRTYGVQSYTPDALRSVLAQLAADPQGKSKASRAYIRDFLTGRPDVLLPLVWPKYVCSLTHATAAGFARCACATHTSAAGQ